MRKSTSRRMRLSLVSAALVAGTAGSLLGPAMAKPKLDSAGQSSSVVLDAKQSTVLVPGSASAETRDLIVSTGAHIAGHNDDGLLVRGTDEELAAVRAAGVESTAVADITAEANARVAAEEQRRAAAGEVVVAAGDFPAGDEGYHTYDEANAVIDELVAKYPNIATKFDIGKSYEGRTIYGIKISDNARVDENEPEVLQNCTIHAREHLTTEMCLYMARELTSKYATEDRIRKIVDGQEILIIPMLNPDGAMYDIRGGRYQGWRKNRQPGRQYNGIDLNRNFAFQWGCCNGSSGNESSDMYRGSAPESGVETKRLADFVRSRNLNGEQQIKAYIDWHTYSELVLWPMGYTRANVTNEMNADEYAVHETMGKMLGRASGYTPKKASGLYITDGSTGDWTWGDQKIFSFMMEMYPRQGNRHGFYPPDELIEQETTRNREMFLTFLEYSDCMWRVTGQDHKCQKPTNPTTGPTTGPTTSPTGTPTPNPTVTSSPTPTATATTTPGKPWPWPWPWPWPPRG